MNKNIKSHDALNKQNQGTTTKSKKQKPAAKEGNHHHHHIHEKPKYPQRDETDPFSRESWVY